MTDSNVSVKRPVKEAEAEFLYAVFESYERKGDNRYFVYKRDHSSGASASASVGDDSLPDLGDPIWSSSDPSNSDVKFVSDMIVFSSSSSIYFVGGYGMGTGEYQRDAFRLDLGKDKLNPSSGTSIHLVPIHSMKSIKPFPLTFGPIEDHFYIFSASDDCSFESFNLKTERWASLPLPESNPDIKQYLYASNDSSSDLSFIVRAAAVCDSNIYFTPFSSGPLLVFFTKSGTWGLISYWTIYGHLSLPFDGIAAHLTLGNEEISINRPYTNIHCSAYKCPYSPVNENFKMPPIDSDDYHSFLEPFGLEGEVGGLEDRLQKLGCYEWDEIPEMLFWSFDNKPGRICLVPCDERRRPYHMRSLFHICDLTLVEGQLFKVEVKSIVTYKHRPDRLLMPRHFLFA